MWDRKHSVTLSIIICFILLAILTALVFIGPWIVEIWFTKYRGWAQGSFAVQDMLTLFKICFYPCAVFAYITLYSLIKMLFNIKRDEIFTEYNTKALRRISWCCLAVAIITFAGGIFYVPFLFVAIAAGFMGLMLRIIKNVMQNAVALREENDLTI